MRIEERFTVEGLSDVLVNYTKSFIDPPRGFNNSAFIMLHSASGSDMGVHCIDEIYKKLKESGNPVSLIEVKLGSFSVSDLMRVIEPLNRDPDVINILCLEGIETAEIPIKSRIYDMAYSRISKTVLERSDIPGNCIVFLPIWEEFMDSISNVVKNRMTLFGL